MNGDEPETNAIEIAEVEEVEGELLPEVAPAESLAVLTADTVGPALSRRRRVKAQRLKSGAYRIQLRDPLNPDGPRINIQAWDEQEVIARAARVSQMRRDMKMGIGTTPEHIAHMRAVAEGPYTVERAWTEYIATLSDSTRLQYKNGWKNHFAEVFGGVTLSAVTEEMMSRWEKACAKKHRASTIELNFNMLSAALRRHIPHRIAALPWKKWKPSGIGFKPTRDRGCFRSIDEVCCALLVARRRDVKLRAWGYYACLEAILTVAIFCGLRQGELGGLGWDDLRIADVPAEGEPEEMSILQVRHTVKRQWNKKHIEWTRPMDPPKGRKKRAGQAGKGDVPQRLHPQVVRVLREQRAYLERFGFYAPDGPVFPTPAGAWRVDEETVKNDLFRAVLREAFPDWPESKVSTFVMHSNRHSFSTLEAAAMRTSGGNVRDLAERTRHRDMKVLWGYIHSVGEGLAAPNVPDVAPELRSFEAMAAAAARGELMAGEHKRGALPPVALMTSEICERVERAKAIEVLQKKAKGAGADFERCYREWVAAGRPGKRPKEVSEYFRYIYRDAYVRRLRESTAPSHDERKKEASSYAKRVRWATVGSWQKFIRARGEAPQLKGARVRIVAPEGNENADGAATVKASTA